MEKIWLQHYDKGIPHTIDPDQYHNINDILQECFTHYAVYPFLISYGSTLSYQEVDDLSNRFAKYLQYELKLKKGDRFAILMANVFQYPIVMLAALRLGLIIVNIPFILGDNEITSAQVADMLKRTEPKAIIVLENFSPILEGALKHFPMEHVIVTEIGDLFSFFKRKLFHYVLRYQKKVPPCHISGAIPFRETLNLNKDTVLTPVDVEPHDTAFLQFTSARDEDIPKCVEITHRNMIAHILQTEPWAHAGYENIFQMSLVCNFPFFHAVGPLLLCGAARHNDVLVLILDPFDVHGLVVECQKLKKGISYMTGIDLIFQAYLKDKDFTHVDFSNIKVTLGTGVISSNTYYRWRVLTHNSILQVYVITEATVVVCMTPISNQEYLNTVGVPVPSTEVKICSPEGIEQPLNQRGELWIRGPQIMKGYWRDPERTRRAFTEDGWFKTGDIGFMNEKGYITMVERVSDLIKYKGHIISPAYIENVIKTVEGVAECAVIGVKLNSKQNETETLIVAYIVKNNPLLTAETILQTCKEYLIEHQVPHEIEFIESIPRAGLGYILRRTLREQRLKKASLS